jgi:enoyl-CoA hydratase/carnithine racemase
MIRGVTVEFPNKKRTGEVAVQNQRVQMAIDANGVAWVTLSRPAQHNAVDFAMLDEIAAVQRRLRREKSVRGAIIHGEGPSFCAGLDFKSVFSSKRNLLRSVLSLYAPRRNIFQRWSMGWRDLPFPVIAVVHGHCYGAGMQLALGADQRIAAPDAKMSLMEVKWGLVPDMGGPTLLRELMSIDVAKELVLSGRIVTGEEAVRLGLASRVEDDPLAAAAAQIAVWAQRSPDALAAGKFLLQDAWSDSEFAALSAERRWQRRIIGRWNQRLAMRLGLKKGSDEVFRPRTVQK